MPNPWVSLRRDQLILVNHAVNKKKQFKNRAVGGGGIEKNEISMVKIYIKQL
jgi:hypothetical protein